MNKVLLNTYLDQLDMMIAAELDVNARQTTRDLGARLSVSASTISSRIRKMVDSGAITFAVLCNP
ncbi:MAG: AsnC family transcriptional regulator, partial [Dehalococcoidia bacterium]